jgi:hypothetical protein
MGAPTPCPKCKRRPRRRAGDTCAPCRTGREVPAHPAAMRPARAAGRRSEERRLVLGDIHFKWQHRRALKWALQLARDYRPTLVAQVGDLYDKWNWSRFPRSLSVCTPEEEENESRAMAEEFFGKLAQASPGADRIIIPGNHDLRPYLRAMEKNPESAHTVKAALTRDLSFNGYRTASLDHPEWVVGGRLYQHGHAKAGTHAPHNQMSTWVGHTHTGGVWWFRNLRGLYFEANAGFLGDETAPVFNYTPHKTVRKGTVGLGLDDAHGPRFVPYPGR